MPAPGTTGLPTRRWPRADTGSAPGDLTRGPQGRITAPCSGNRQVLRSPTADRPVRRFGPWRLRSGDRPRGVPAHRLKGRVSGHRLVHWGENRESTSSSIRHKALSNTSTLTDGNEMNTTPKGTTRSNCVQKRANRMLPVSHRLVTSISVGLMCAVVLTPSVVGDNSVVKVNSTLGYLTPGSTVQVNKGVEIYAEEPSKYYGNLLNKKIWTTKESETYVVMESEFYKEYPSFSGNQVWIKLRPESAPSETWGDQSPEAASCWRAGCWAFFGWHRSESAEGFVARDEFAKLHPAQ